MQRPLPVSLLVVLLGSLSGCVAYVPSPLDPARELASLRSRDLDHVVNRSLPPSSFAGIAGQTFDPSDGLDEWEVVTVALTLNTDLLAKRSTIGEAQAALVSAGLFPNPEIGLSPKIGIGGASGYSVDVDALFQFLRVGERRAKKQVAIARIDEAKADVVAEEFKLVAEVRTQRLLILAADRAVALLAEGVQLRERAVQLVRQRRQIGEGTELEVSATELELAEARRDLREAEVELATETRELNHLMGLPTSFPLRLVGMGNPLTIVLTDDLTDDELDRRMLAGRMELRAKEAEYRRTEEELRLAVKQQYPQLGIGPAYERELEGDQALGLALSLGLPLFNQNQGEIAERKAARERARAEYVSLLHRLRAEAFSARAAVRTAKNEVEIQEREILPLLKRNQELFEGAFRARELNIIDWITAQQRAVNARREYLKALVQYRRALITFESASGRLLPEPTAATNQPATTTN